MSLSMNLIQEGNPFQDANPTDFNNLKTRI